MLRSGNAVSSRDLAVTAYDDEKEHTRNKLRKLLARMSVERVWWKARPLASGGLRGLPRLDVALNEIGLMLFWPAAAT